LQEAEENLNNKQPLGFINYLIIFLKWKKLIIWVTLIATIISIVLFFFVFDLIYFSTATIKSSGKASFFLGGFEGLPDIGGLEDLTGGGRSTRELALYQEILTSRRCLEPLIEKFQLMNRDEHKYMEDALRDFRDNKLKLDFDKIAGVLYIGVYDKNKQLAKEMVEFLLEELNKINIELSVTNARNNREFVEKRYFQSKEDLTKAEDSLKSYQLIYGIAPDMQVKAAAQTAFAIESELKAEEVKLDVLKKILSSDQPEVKTQETKVNSLKSKISEIQNSTDLNELLRLGNSPQIVLNYLRLQREVEIQTKILTFLLPLYEQSKIEEKRETPTIIILEKPYIADRKSKPKRLTMVFVTMFVSFFIISLAAILYDVYIKKIILTVKSHK
jgi:capsule polysaccharide export protein KpsE/RkpR